MKIRYFKILFVATLFVSPIIFSSCSSSGPGAAPASSPLIGAAQSDTLISPPNPSRSGIVSNNAKTQSNLGSVDTTSVLPRSRPGLGTGWGNQITSNIGYSDFTRASSKPAGTSSIYYNDKEGVEATAGIYKYKGNGMQKAAGGLIEWGVKSNWGILKNYHSGGRRYVVGSKGRRYALVVKNISHSPLEVVLSVDGLDVMNGRPASFKARGYIIPAGKTLNVKGFRTSESAVAAFKFSSVSNSYSSLRHGQSRNVGVIGAAVFTQKGVDPWKWSRPSIDARHSASPFAEAPPTRAR